MSDFVSLRVYTAISATDAIAVTLALRLARSAIDRAPALLKSIARDGF
jgi:hypothetical protein